MRKLDPTHYESASEEKRFLVLKNSVLLLYRHRLRGVREEEAPFRERDTSQAGTREETLARIRGRWRGTRS
jgi:hypothetical protein